MTNQRLKKKKRHHESDVEGSQEDLNHKGGGDGCQGDGEEPPVSNDYFQTLPAKNMWSKLLRTLSQKPDFCNQNLVISSWKPHSLSENHPQYFDIYYT